jgi:hypothetical protein
MEEEHDRAAERPDVAEGGGEPQQVEVVDPDRIAGAGGGGHRLGQPAVGALVVAPVALVEPAAVERVVQQRFEGRVGEPRRAVAARRPEAPDLAARVRRARAAAEPVVAGGGDPGAKAVGDRRAERGDRPGGVAAAQAAAGAVGERFTVTDNYEAATRQNIPEGIGGSHLLRCKHCHGCTPLQNS